MAKRLKKIKRDHRIQNGVGVLLESIAEIPEIKRIIPGIISRGGRLTTMQPTAYLKVQRKTISGLKLLAHTDEAIQEIFLVIAKDKRDDVWKEIENLQRRKQ